MSALAGNFRDECVTAVGFCLSSHSAVRARLGRREQADPVHTEMLPLEGRVLGQLQRHGEAPAVSGAGPGAHGYHLEMARRWAFSLCNLNK